MKSVTKEWVEKAEGDRGTAGRELRVKRGANYNAVCFHAQQCAEKYLKALLTERGTHFPKTHDLVALAKLAPEYEAELGPLLGELELLSRYAVAPRYPGSSATRTQATRGVKAMKKARALLKRLVAAGPKG